MVKWRRAVWSDVEVSSSPLNKIEAAMKLKDVSQSPQSLLAERIAVEALAFYGH
jgi:hypothetical protein